LRLNSTLGEISALAAQSGFAYCIKAFEMKLLIKLMFLEVILCQLVACHTAPKEATALSRTAKPAEIHCVVDSRIYSQPQVRGPGNLVPVPLRDGALVSIVRSSSGISKIAVSPGPTFRRCAEKTYAISDFDEAKSLVEFSRIQNSDVFVGTELAVCNTIDEGWFFILGKKTAYIGYAGPMEKPIAFVGMSCE
jgi:hypothetical protein